eukprot:CAMPEP_0169455868 /NCGR_PEP_ID=MMETSP1042-20121227/16048_1 /TAXON_ID=464988 /ORGANISM="Hemiselmis andersenii, Strain CCMP1180" /LENGTH=61 /DNA_ID=CAMNT_0009568051 /DNA_START=745 /DNA_END=930 /DNA_ORIENTATION=-
MILSLALLLSISEPSSSSTACLTSPLDKCIAANASDMEAILWWSPAASHISIAPAPTLTAP